MSPKLCPFCMRMTVTETCPHCGKNVNYAGSPTHLPVGYVVSGKHPYVLGAALGQGGFGITYIALDMVTNERVAIKEYYPTYCSARTSHSNVTAYTNQEDIFEKGKESFLKEAQTLKNLSDLKSIVNVLDFFEANNSAYLVMEFLEGSSLKEYVAKHGIFPIRDFLNQIKPLMEDIHRMHEQGVIHRDIAPDNIMLMPDGQMKLIDFGAARSYVGGKSMTMVVKKGYAPVEQYLSRGATASTDVYALAATFYFCITGSVPPDSAERQYDNTALTSPKSLGVDIAPHQEKAILKAMKVQQKERTQTVQEFLDDLQNKRSPILFLIPRFRKFLLLLLPLVLILIGICFLLSGKTPDRESTASSIPDAVQDSPASEQTETVSEEDTSIAAVEDTIAATAEDATTATEEVATDATEEDPAVATEETLTAAPSENESIGSGSSGSSSSGSGSSGSGSSGTGSSGSGSSGSGSSGGDTVVVLPPVVLPPVVLPPPIVPPPVVLPPVVLPPIVIP